MRAMVGGEGGWSGRLTEKVASEQRPAGGEGTIHVEIWGNHMLMRWNNEWKILSWEQAWYA